MIRLKKHHLSGAALSLAKGVSLPKNLGAASEQSRSFSWSKATPQEVVVLGDTQRHFSCMFEPPPSANKIWRSDRGRAPHKSTEYEAWLDAVGWKLAGKCAREQHIAFTVPVEVVLTIPKKHGLSDLDNRIKPCLDALQRGCVVKNDNLIHRLEVSWRPKTYADQEQVWALVRVVEQ